MGIDGYPVVMDLPILWSDQDLFGHVNNTVALRWFQSSRVAYWDNSGMRQMMEPLHLGPILASLKCDYKHQINYPGNIQVSARVKKLGNTSMTLEHLVFDHTTEEIAATGSSVVVMFDYKNQRKHELFNDLRAVIEQFEGRIFARQAQGEAG